jgi:hypothetical protein
MSQKIKVKRIKSNYEDVLDHKNKNEKRPNGSPIHESNIVKLGATLNKQTGKVRLGESISNVKAMFKAMYGDEQDIKVIENYYNETFVSIPPLGLKNEGVLELEVGFENPNKGKFEVYKEGKEEVLNLPINIPDYIKYLILLEEPSCAKTESEKNAHHKAYIIDEQDLVDAKKNKMQAKLKANTELMKLQDKDGNFNPEDMKKYLYLFKSAGIDFGKTITKMKPSEYDVILDATVAANPDLFLQLVNDKEKDIKYTIELMIAHDVLNISKSGKISNMYDEIGNMNETISWFKDKANLSELSVLKQKLEDKLKIN